MTLSTSLLYNKAVNNNILTLTKQDIDQFGTRVDFARNPPQHVTPVRGTAQSDAANFNATAAGTTSFGTGAYYGYSLNPFENYLFTGRLGWAINDKVSLSVEPYYWYGYGTGGTQQTTLTESSGATRFGFGIADMNGDGDTLDTVGVYRGSVTKTNRPGVNVKLTANIENHKLLFGVWYERARHRQTQPATFVDNFGGVGDIWLRNNLVRRNDGTLYQGRDWLTISTGNSVFLQDTINMMDDRLEVTLGIKRPEIKRDFTNYASEGGLGTYQVTRTYTNTLPYLGLRFQLNPQFQFFGNVTKNARAPSNFVQSGWVRGTSTIVNGQVAAFTLTPNDTIKSETSVNIEGGVRYNGPSFSTSATIFRTNFKDRLTSTRNDVLGINTDANAGDVRLQGLELEAGTKPINGFSVYGSLTYTDSKMLTDLKVNATQFLNTAGKEFPDTAKVMAGMQVQWSNGPFLIALSGKYTGKRYATLFNDEEVPENTVFNLNAAYRFANMGMFKKPTIRFNVTNLFNKEYYVLNAGSGSNIRPTNGRVLPPGITSIANSGVPTYYVGAPRFASITLSTEF